MAELIIPDPRFEAPELFYPGRKPLYPIRINWDNTITKGLVLCAPYMENHRDLVTGRFPTLASGASDMGTIEPSVLNLARQGNTASCDSGAVFLDFYSLEDGDKTTTAMVFYAQTLPIAAWERFSLLGIGEPTSFDNGFYLYIDVDGSSVPTAVGELSSKSLSFTVNPPLYTMHSLASILDYPGTNASLYFNGLLVSSDTMTDDLVAPTDRGVVLGAAFNASDGDALLAKLSIYLPLIWNRVLSDAEILSMHRNPYQFLIPA